MGRPPWGLIQCVDCCLRGLRALAGAVSGLTAWTGLCAARRRGASRATGPTVESRLRACRPRSRSSKGARVINTSFVLTEANAALRDAIRNGTASGVFFAG